MLNPHAMTILLGLPALCRGYLMSMLPPTGLICVIYSTVLRALYPPSSALRSFILQTWAKPPLPDLGLFVPFLNLGRFVHPRSLRSLPPIRRSLRISPGDPSPGVVVRLLYR